MGRKTKLKPDYLKRVRKQISIPLWLFERLKKEKPNHSSYIVGLVLKDTGWIINKEEGGIVADGKALDKDRVDAMGHLIKDAEVVLKVIIPGYIYRGVVSKVGAGGLSIDWSDVVSKALVGYYKIKKDGTQ